MRNNLLAGVLVLTTSAVANPVHDQMAALSQEARHDVLQRMMAREGHQCGQVVASFFQGSSSDGSAFWSLSCRPGVDWQLMLGGAAGTNIKILKCETVGRLGSRPCFQRFRS